MAGGMPCSNDDGNEASVVVNNLAGDSPQWVCGFCLGTLGLATLVQLGACTEAQAKALLEGQQEPAAENEPAAPAPRAKRARKSGPGKVTGDTGETTPLEEHPCAGELDECTGQGVHPGPAEDGGTEWLCHSCYSKIMGAGPSPAEA